MTQDKTNRAVAGASPLRARVISAIGALLILSFTAFLFLTPSRRVLAGAKLSDGRIIQVEGISYGTEHRIGRTSFLLDHFRRQLPQKIRAWLEPKSPQSVLSLDEPGLVIWVNAIDAVTGTNVDCQSVRLEFVDGQGDLFGDEGTSWFGSQKYWRVGHFFHAFPRDEKNLTLRISTVLTKFMGQTNSTVQVTVPNLFRTRAAIWSGQPLPQTNKIGDVQLALTALRERTNGSPQRSWETPTRYWEPVWEFRGPAAGGGWETPEWIAEDPLGNRSQHLGIHQPVIRFTATVYPQATNAPAVQVVAVLPALSSTNLTNDLIWNQAGGSQPNNILAIGCLPAGMHVFSGGLYLTNPPAYGRMGATLGGADSGWVGSSRRISPTKVDQFDGHYAPVPVIYLQTRMLGSTNRLAIRLRDQQGRFWMAKPEPQGYREWIMPFLLELPEGVTNVVPEVLVLKPVRTSFVVQTGAQAQK